VRRDAQAVLLLLVGGTLLKISFTGTYIRYVKPGLLPLLLAAGFVLVAVAAVTLGQVLRGHGRGGDKAGHAEHGHGHGGGKIAWLLLLPTLTLLVFAPPAIGSYQADRNGTALGSQPSSDFAPLPAGDPVRVSLLDYAGRAVFEEGRSLQGRRVSMSGFIIAGQGGQPYLARMIVTCCAADARPIKLGLMGALPTGLVQDQWVEIVGTYTDRIDHDAVNGEVIPYVLVEALRTIPTPEAQYES
jgi:uncharacterized repeat protein (TIGR03943 family)